MRAIRLLLVCAAAYPLCAQDPFEINVYEYEPLPMGSFTYEAHINYVLSGTRRFDGPMAPSYQQLHFSSELTAGLSESFAAGFVLLTAKREGGEQEYAGFRIVPHFYAPESWKLPFRFGLVAEFSSQSTTYVENSKQLEIRPILEKQIGRFDFDFNPVFSHAVGRQEMKLGWVLEPAARFSWKMGSALRPSLEYYGTWGPVSSPHLLGNSTHQILPGADLRIGKNLTWSFGLGWSNNPAARLIFKSRFEFEFGRKPTS
jgi:hypothetical protein